MKLKEQLELKKQMDNFRQEEGEWIDEIVRKQYPKWIIWLSEKFFNSVILRITIAKFSGISIKRNQDVDIGSISGKNGFRRGGAGYTIKRVTTRVFKKGKQVAERKFELNLHFRGEFNPNVLENK